MRTLITWLLISTATTAIFAENAPSDSLAGEQPRHYQLPQVEITASRREATSSAPLHRIDAERLSRSGITDMADAINRLPGVTLRDYGGAGGMKTVAVRGFGASHTAVTYDGIALSDAQTGQIDLSRHSLDNLGSLTLIVGDNDDIFIPARAAASAATLQIATLLAAELGSDSSATAKGTARLRLGAWRMANPSARVAARCSQKLSVGGSAEFLTARNNYPFTLHNGEATVRERRTNSKINSGRGELNLRWLPTASTSLTAKAYGYGSARRLPGPVIYYNNDCNERLHETEVFAQAALRSRLNSRLSLMALAKFNYSASAYTDRDERYPGGLLDQRYWQREYYAAAALLYIPSNHWQLDYSADFFHNNLNSTLPTDTRPRRNSLLQSATARMRYGRLTLTGRLLLSVYDNGAATGEGAADATRLSPSLSVSLQPLSWKALTLRASYKEIFRMPTFSEAYFDHLGSRDLLPENTRQFNLGATLASGRLGPLEGVLLTADAYFNRVDNKISAVPYNMFVWRMVNLAKVDIRGLDIALSVSWSPTARHRLTLDGNYSLQHARNRTSRQASDWNKQLAYTPEQSGSASLAWQNPWVDLTVHTTATGHRFTTNNNRPGTRLPGYAETGVTLQRRVALGGDTSLTLRADLLNIFDKEYEIVANYPMPGRSWLAAATLEF